MCCARTAALQGGYEKQKVNASRDFLQQSLHHVQKSFESYQKACFVAVCAMPEYEVYKTSHKLWFCCIKSLWAMHAHWYEKFMENKIQNLQNLIFQNRAWSVQEREKKAQKRKKTHPRRAGPRRATERNMRQHDPNMANLALELGACPLSLRKEKQHVNASIKRSINKV